MSVLKMKPLKGPVLYGDQGTNGQIKETSSEPECHRQWDQTDTGIGPSKIGRSRMAQNARSEVSAIVTSGSGALPTKASHVCPSGTLAYAE
jgi:hypothetical protein